MSAAHRCLQNILVGLILAISLPALASFSSYNYFAPGGALSCTAPCTAQNVNLSAGTPFIAGNLPLANTANLATNTVLANVSGSTAPAAAVNPLAIANLLGAVIAADVSTGNGAGTNITLSGVQTIDGQAGFVGEVVMLPAQTNPVENGLWIMQSGAWTRAVNFPAGYTTPVGCTIVVFVEKGITNQSLHWTMTTSSAVTIGTNANTWTQRPVPSATTTVSGIVPASNNTAAQKVARVAGPPGAGGAANNDCVSFTDANGSIGDSGDWSGTTTGPCTIMDQATGHVVLYGDGTLPTASTGAIQAASSDNRGRVTGLTAATALTITFAHAFPYIPSCGVSGTAALASLTVTPTVNNVAFAMTAYTGSVQYWCF